MLLLFPITSNPEFKSSIEKEPIEEIRTVNASYHIPPVNTYVADKLKKMFFTPNLGLVDRTAYDIAEEAVRVMQERAAATEALFKEHQQALEDLNALVITAETADKDQDGTAAKAWAEVKAFRENNAAQLNEDFYIPYAGVLICDDVPNYLIPHINSYVHREGYKLFWLYNRPVVETVGYKDEGEHIKIPIDEITSFEPPRIITFWLQA